MTKIEKIIAETAPTKTGVKLSNIKGEHSAWKVSLQELLFNPFNDRFAMEIQSWRKEHDKQLGFDEKSQNFLFEMLSSNKARNKKTRDDIIENGVLKPIVIDLNGVVLDGNRRVSILKTIMNNNKLIKSLGNKRADEFLKPEVVIIKKAMEEDEIRDYETTLQISEDEKVEYDPINIYLKIDRLFNSSDHLNEDGKIKDVSRKMGANYKDSDIKKRIEVFSVMKMYLKFLKRDGEFTFLRKKEDHFKQIQSFYNSYNNSSIKFEKGEKMSREQFSKVRDILYGLTAAHVEGKQFREYIPSNKKSGKSALQSTKGIDEVYDSLYVKHLLKFREEPVSVSDPAFDRVVKGKFESAKYKSNMTNAAFGIRSEIEKLTRATTEVMSWSQKLIGGHNITSEYLQIKGLKGKMEIIEKKLEETLKKYEERNLKND